MMTRILLAAAFIVTVVVAPAHAGAGENGTKINGTSLNGSGENGTSLNGNGLSNRGLDGANGTVIRIEL